MGGIEGRGGGLKERWMEGQRESGRLLETCRTVKDAFMLSISIFPNLNQRKSPKTIQYMHSRRSDNLEGM